MRIGTRGNILAMARKRDLPGIHAVISSRMAIAP